MVFVYILCTPVGLHLRCKKLNNILPHRWTVSCYFSMESYQNKSGGENLIHNISISKSDNSNEVWKTCPLYDIPRCVNTQVHPDIKTHTCRFYSLRQKQALARLLRKHWDLSSQHSALRCIPYMYTLYNIQTLWIAS